MRGNNNNGGPARRTSSFLAVARSISRNHHKGSGIKQHHHRPSMAWYLLTTVVSICCLCLATLYSTHQRSFSFFQQQQAARQNRGNDIDEKQSKWNQPRSIKTTRRTNEVDGGGGSKTSSSTRPASSGRMFRKIVAPEPRLPTTLTTRSLQEDAVDAQVCPDCYSRVIDTRTMCGEKIVKHYKSTSTNSGQKDNDKDNASFRHDHAAARRAVALDHPVECGVCDPSACADHQTIFRRPDRMAPTIQVATTHYLTNIPDEERVPHLVNRTEYFSHEANVYPQRQYLFEYNPSIIVLPEEQRVDVGGEMAYYLASYRVSNLQQCIYGEEESLMLGKTFAESGRRPLQKDYLALALLRRDLSIIVDVVLELRRVVKGAPRGEDFRLFLFPPHNQIVVTSFDFIMPIWLHNTTGTSDSDGEGTIVEVPQYAPSPLRVYTRTFASCTPFIRPGTKYNKNLNYFVGADGNLMVEYKPMTTKYRMPLSSEESSPIAPCVRGSNPEPPIESELPMRSFDTVDILHFWKQGLFEPYSNERGSACCISIDHPNDQAGRKLLVGISHSKTLYPRMGRSSKSGDVPSNMFFSSLYAMEDVYPYKVVALSGRFCLGHATEAEHVVDHNGNPFARSNLSPLRIDREYDCPRIHFVSGLSEVVDDPTSVIIGYGINDCVPRFVQVKKTDLVQLLFFGNNNIGSSSSEQ
jgi:hypothetical protein